MDANTMVRINTARARAAFEQFVSDQNGGKVEAARQSLVEALDKAYQGQRIAKRPPSDSTFIYRWIENRNKLGIPADAWSVVEGQLGCETGELIDTETISPSERTNAVTTAFVAVKELSNLELTIHPRNANAVLPDYNVSQTVAVEVTISFGATLFEWEDRATDLTYKAYLKIQSARLDLSLRDAELEEQNTFGNKSGVEYVNDIEVANMGGTSNKVACYWNLNNSSHGTALKGKLHIDQLCVAVGRFDPRDSVSLLVKPAWIQVGSLLGHSDVSASSEDKIRAGVARRFLEIITRDSLPELGGFTVLCEAIDWLGSRE